MFRDCRESVPVATHVRPAVLVAALVLASLLAGCASTPEPEELVPELYLMPGHSAYFSADVLSNRDLFTYVVTQLGGNLSTVVDRTYRISGGVTIIPGISPDLTAIASGNFPEGATRFALNGDRNFEKQSAQVNGKNIEYYRSTTGTIQVALPRSGLIFVSNGLILSMVDRSLAEAAAVAARAAPLADLLEVGLISGQDAAMIFPDPGAVLLGRLGIDPGGIPVERISLYLRRHRFEPGVDDPASADDEEIELSGAFELRTPEEAALFRRLGRLFILLFIRTIGLDSSGIQGSFEITANENVVVFTGVIMNRDELVGVVRRVVGLP